MSKGILTDFIRGKIAQHMSTATRGDYSLQKYSAVAVSLYNAKGDVVAAGVGVSYGMYRVWRTEPGFLKTIDDLAADFIPVFWTAATKYLMIAGNPEGSDFFRKNFDDVLSYGDEILVRILDSIPAEFTDRDQMNLFVLLDNPAWGNRSRKECRQRIAAYSNNMAKKLYAQAITIIEKEDMSLEEKGVIRAFILHHTPN